MGADLEAYQLARLAVPTLSEAEHQYALTVARGESFYGRAWATPSADTRARSARFGLLGTEGTGSNNWGAMQGTGSAGSFQHVDRHADGSDYVGTFMRFLTPEEGYQRFARRLYESRRDPSRAVRAAVRAGDLSAAVNAQRATGYFELSAEKYLEAVRRNYAELTKNLGWQPLLANGGSGGGLLGLAVSAGLVYALTKYLK